MIINQKECFSHDIANLEQAGCISFTVDGTASWSKRKISSVEDSSRLVVESGLHLRIHCLKQ